MDSSRGSSFLVDRLP